MLKIGITGHRDLNKEHISKYKLELLKQFKTLKQQYNKIIIYSSLADGADRLVVHEAIKENIDFVAVLPMDKNEYKEDFTYYSKKEFDLLLKKASVITTLTYKESVTRKFKYESAGKYVSDNCDILIALWDGVYNNLQGGTSDIIKYHLKKKKALYHIKVNRNVN